MKSDEPEHIEHSLVLAESESLFDKQVLTVKEAALLLGFSAKTVYKLAARGEIPCKRIGSEYRFLQIQLLDWVGGKVK